MFRRFVFPLALSALIGVALVSSSSVGQAAAPPPCQDSTCVQPRVGFSCPPGMVWTRINGQAACDYCDTATQPPTDTQTLSCPPPQVGSIVQERAYVCNQPTNTWIPGPWNTVSNSCAFGACPGPAPAPDTQTVACPFGQTGSITQERSYACSGAPSFTWNAGPWVETSNTCAGASCPGQNPGPETQTVACPVGQTGSITQQRTWSCSGAPSWIYQPDAWVEISNTCMPSAMTCPAGPASWGSYCTGTLPSGSVGDNATVPNLTAPYSGSAVFQCTGSLSWMQVSSACVGCPPGQSLINGVCTPDPPVDLCLNLPGDQGSVPPGYSTTNGGGPGYCCPTGQNWNGSTCQAATCTAFNVSGRCNAFGCNMNFAYEVLVQVNGGNFATAPPDWVTVKDALYDQCALFHNITTPGISGSVTTPLGSTGWCNSWYEPDLYETFVTWAGQICSP
ncbi:MAG: hypothetical protein ACK58P_14650 [Betaproteobacteria bacterium]